MTPGIEDKHELRVHTVLFHIFIRFIRENIHEQKISGESSFHNAMMAHSLTAWLSHIIFDSDRRPTVATRSNSAFIRFRSAYHKMIIIIFYYSSITIGAAVCTHFRHLLYFIFFLSVLTRGEKIIERKWLVHSSASNIPNWFALAKHFRLSTFAHLLFYRFSQCSSIEIG